MENDLKKPIYNIFVELYNETGFCKVSQFTHFSFEHWKFFLNLLLKPELADSFKNFNVAPPPNYSKKMSLKGSVQHLLDYSEKLD